MRTFHLLGGMAALLVVSAASGSFAATAAHAHAASAVPVASPGQLRQKTSPDHPGKTNRVVRPRQVRNCRRVYINRKQFRIHCSGPVYR